VAREIVAAGGRATADSSDVSSVAGGQSLIDKAVEGFGRVDIVVNNAGIIRWAGFPEADADNLESHLAVHVGGSFNTTRAAWPHMVEQGYGRIVMTTSTGMFGLPDNLGYATAKAAVVGMTRSLTAAGAAHGIKINLIAPNAWTRMGAHPSTESLDRPAPKQMEPELVAPMVAFLAHERCAVSGEIYVAGAGRFSRIFLAATEGYVHDRSDQPTIEDVADHWAAINDEDGYYVPADLLDWSKHFMAHRRPS
jgi:NAD(P)-dependent dehydrogenase (short-subunit alcohol dehydrogenase family)